MRMTRRALVKSSLAALTAGSFAGQLFSEQLSAGEKKKHIYEVGAWMNGLEAFDQAKKNGLDVLQVTFPLHPTDKNDFRDPETCKRFLERSKETNIRLASIAIGNFNGNPFWQIDDAVRITSDCIDAMVRLKIDNVLIAFFGKAKLDTDEKFNITIERLKQVAPKAEAAGVKLAVESTLGADGHLRIIDGVKSPAVQVFYDPGNMIHNFNTTEGICSDIRKLKGLIAACHAKDSTLLGKGRIDYAKILDTYREVGFFGAQILEGSNDKTLGVDESQRRNAMYLRSL